MIMLQLLRTQGFLFHRTRNYGMLTRRFSSTTGDAQVSVESSNKQHRVHCADNLVTGLNGAQDISVKVVSCKGVVQEILRRREMSSLAAKSLGEAIACSLMMGAGLKGEETLQINLVGSGGLQNIMVMLL